MNESTAQAYLAGLPRNKQCWFLACLCHELTIIGRVICADHDQAEAVPLLQSLNEVQHRLTGLLATALGHGVNDFPEAFVATMFFGDRADKRLAAILAGSFERLAAAIVQVHRPAV